ncbi:hypothetical protein NE237_028916 [Protea cynaroides]|uniref:Uncharacterized protein n=1 Tax=Protea cynaroides TaxID=273540 RepID=A0A9Q0JTB8_9MAGN|nr:hypothetical protein NE237_028916 [Protea cynaroides]
MRTKDGNGRFTSETDRSVGPGKKLAKENISLALILAESTYSYDFRLFLLFPLFFTFILSLRGCLIGKDLLPNQSHTMVKEAELATGPVSIGFNSDPIEIV